VEKESTLKLDKKPKEENDDSCCELDDEEEAKFVRKLKRGLGKYKGKLPFKCFNCGKICQYASKFPEKKKDYDPRENSRKYKNIRRRLRRRAYTPKKLAPLKVKLANPQMRIEMMKVQRNSCLWL